MLQSAFLTETQGRLDSLYNQQDGTSDKQYNNCRNGDVCFLLEVYALLFVVYHYHYLSRKQKLLIT